jgi:Fe-S cluster assembly protein SufD
MSGALATRIAEQYAGAYRAGGATARQQAALAALTAAGLPTTRDENWKYANLRALERLSFVPVPAAALPGVPQLPPPLPGFTRYVFIDGRFAANLSQPAEAAGAHVQRLTDAAAPAAAPATGDTRFALLNAVFARDGARIELPRAAAPLALEFVFVARAPATQGASYPALQVALAADTRLQLIERHVGDDGSTGSLVVSAVAATLERGAALQHYRLQELNRRSTLLDTLELQLAAGASYRLRSVSIGAQNARATLSVRVAGEAAEVDLALAALGDGQQVQDTYALVTHTAPAARTTQTFRGIAAGRARVACNGKIVVSQEAQRTDSRQSLRGLLAGSEAEIDVRPQLEIYTDDVRCSHGATAGKLDENMLFYLLSRGLDRDSAQRLLKWAFLEDVIAQIDIAALRRHIEERLTSQLQDDALRELL